MRERLTTAGLTLYAAIWCVAADTLWSIWSSRGLTGKARDCFPSILFGPLDPASTRLTVGCAMILLAPIAVLVLFVLRRRFHRIP